MSEDLLNSGALRRGLILTEQRRYPEAENYFREALAQNPRDAFALHHLAVCQLQQNSRAAEALATIERAISIDPRDEDHFVLKAFILCVLDRPGEGLEFARQALQLAPVSSTAFSAEAQALLQMERWADAEKSARRALVFDAEHAVAANQLACALRLQNKMDENASQIAGMLARDPEDPDTHRSAGWSALQRGDHRAAQIHFYEALRRDPGSDDARDGLLQAFKARSPFYRAYLQYCFSMQRLGSGARIGVVLGLLFGAQLALHVFRGSFEVIGLVLGALYLLFVLWVWVARSVGNLFLLFDPFARLVLRRGEKVDAVVVGGGVVAGIALLGIGCVVNSWPPVILGATLVGAAFPFSQGFLKGGSWFYGLLGGIVIAGGLTAMAGELFPAWVSASAAQTGTGFAVACSVMSTWIGGFRSLRKY